MNDGFTDRSVKLTAGCVPDIVFIQQENGGQALASAINAGFERADGELIIFLDADDERA